MNEMFGHQQINDLGNSNLSQAKHWKKDVEYVHHIFNSIHPNLKFTKEEENERKLPFLDVLITKTSNGIKTTVYKKPTFSGLYTKWDSYTPTKYKRNLINNLLHRAHQICSSFTLLHKEFNQTCLVWEKMATPKTFETSALTVLQKNTTKKTSPKKIFSRTLELSFLCGYHLFAKFHRK